MRKTERRRKNAQARYPCKNINGIETCICVCVYEQHNCTRKFVHQKYDCLMEGGITLDNDTALTLSINLKIGGIYALLLQIVPGPCVTLLLDLCLLLYADVQQAAQPALPHLPSLPSLSAQ